MKKSLSRILSVALVLAMIVSAVPFAFAATDSNRVSLSVTSSVATVEPGGSFTATAAVQWPAEAVDPDATYTWTNNSSTGTTATYTADANATEGTVITASVTVSYTYKVPKTQPPVDGDENTSSEDTPQTEDDVEYDTVTATIEEECTVTVEKAPAITSITVQPSSDTIAVGETVPLSAAVEPANAKYSLKWSSSNPSVATVSDLGVVTGVKAGDAVITATATAEEDGKAYEGTASITVEDVAITCANNDVAVGGTVTLRPTLSGVDGEVTYKYATTSNCVSLEDTSGSSVTVKGKSEGVATVKITAIYKLNGTEKETSKNVTVYVYDEHKADFTVKAGVTSFNFDSSDAFSTVKFDDSVLKTVQSIHDVVTTTGANEIKVTVRSSTTATKVGTLSCSGVSGSDLTQVYCSMPNASNIKFTLNGKEGTQYLDYVLQSSDGLTVSKGTISITTGGTSGDITYATDYKTAITFDEDDFADFWNDTYSSSSNTLSYVVFTSLPSYGTLYTTSTKSTKVSTSTKCQYNYSNASGYYDLDKIYYVPSTTKTAEYTVEIPFTAYGGTSTKTYTLSGTVVIELNGSSTSIYSTGVVFGKGSNSIADQIVDEYEDETGKDLAYVIFDLPDVEDGRLYYDYTTILDAENVSKKDEFYVDPGKNDLALDDVAFVPAAGRTGNVTLYYTGYDANGKNAYEGKITLNVVARTSSSYFTDVTTSSYSWAADSIDFLYYQEVVQGSGSKYNPASSITRGDFMIMLYRAFLEGEYGSYKVTSNFADVQKGTTSYSQETYQAVGVAKYLGIAKGDGTNFKPTTSITREEAMTLIYRTLEVMDLSLEYTANTSASSFSDYKTVASYAQSAITDLVKHGIVIGSNGKINPKSNITRAEMAVILHRVLTY